MPAVTICCSILGICGESGGRGGCHIFSEPRMGGLGVQGSQRFTMRHYGCRRQMVVDDTNRLRGSYPGSTLLGLRKWKEKGRNRRRTGKMTG